ncbi:TPA: type I toxin-antitoxin system Ibs family toxin [Escherichia coli]|nr:type I toxin-antitoxin system Ibs family toxin [Escherichia coli]
MMKLLNIVVLLVISYPAY